MRAFVASLYQHLSALTPAELYLIFQQSGLLKTQGESKGFIKALVTGRFPGEEIQNFIEGRPSLVEDFVVDPDLTIRDVIVGDPEDGDSAAKKALWGNEPVEEEEDGDELPVVETAAALSAIDKTAAVITDQEAVEFLLASAAFKLWRHVFQEGQEEVALQQARDYRGTEYADQVRERFFAQYEAAKSLPLPPGNYRNRYGVETPPNLMQRLIASRVRDARRVGNWSGTGAGKTLSAILASRVIDAGLTVICCPNAVWEGWHETIKTVYPDSSIAVKTFTPPTGNGPRYMILNYEMFQSDESPYKIRDLVEQEQIDFVVIDEIHYTKQRHAEDMSTRKKNVQALIAAATERNADLHVLGMSATPVINNLQEGKSLVELITGVSYDDLGTTATLANAMALHQQLVNLGIRWMPDYDIELDVEQVEVDCSKFLDEIRDHGRSKGSPHSLEVLLTKARLPVIREHATKGTVIYTHYITEIGQLLKQELEQDGWRVAFYTGDDKTGLNAFLHNEADVLIGTSAIGTGVDGLQTRSNKMIFNVLPWTNAEFDQIKGRIYRQGQVHDKVKLIIPTTYADVNGERWSWCESKLQRLHYKKSIADAAVDGVVPSGQLRTPAQAYQDVMKWLERLEAGDVQEIERRVITVPLPEGDPVETERRARTYGDFAEMNRRMNTTHSAKTHERLQENPEEWEQYHTLYREARKTWTVVPYEKIVDWCKKRPGITVGDFGCGEALVAAALRDTHTIYSFDHVAINDDVIACDISAVPLEDETLDVAVFSLSLMGSNITDYIREAHRCLKLDGHLHIVEATSRWDRGDGQGGLEDFLQGLRQLGFDVVASEESYKFTFIRALKAERDPQDVQLRFR